MSITSTALPAGDSARVTAHRSLVVGGLGIGAFFGFSGNFIDPGSVQNVFYAASSTGLVVASAVLAVERARAASVFAAAGFAVLALGETRLMNPTDAPGGEASFAVGVLLCAAALLLVGMSTWSPRWVRVVGWMAAVPFAAHALAFLGGAGVDSTGPLAGVGYGLLTVTVVGWILTVLRPTPGSTAPGAERAGVP